MISERSSLWSRVVTSGLGVLLVPLLLSAQEPTGDSLVDRADNPLGRAEFERTRRADPETGLIPAGIRRLELEFASTLPGGSRYVASEKGDHPTTLQADIAWQERGPGNQGGRTRALAIDLNDDSVILAGGVSGGLWRSTDRGDSWTRVTAIDAIHSVTTIVQDPRPGSRDIWYYGTGETRANSAGLPGDGIFRSTDGGLSWKQLPSTVRNTPHSRDQVFDYIHRIVVDPSASLQDVVLAACYGGIVRSDDGGTTWTEVLGGFSNGANYTDIAVTSDGVFYATLSSDAGRTEGIWRSENGVDWTEITPAGFPQTFQRIVPAIAPSREDLVYFFCHTPTTSTKNGHSLWVWDNNGGKGATWEDRTSGLRYNTETYDNYCQTIRVAPWDEDLVFLGHIRLQRTTDGFRDSNNLISQNSGQQHNDQHEIVFFHNDPHEMLTGHDGGISYTADNTADRISWSFRNRGYGTTQFYSIAIDPAGNGSFPIIGGTQDNGSWMISEDGYVDGAKIFGADGGYAAISDSGADFYTSYQEGQIYRSRFDSAWKRTSYARIDPEGGSDYQFIHPFTLDRADTRIMYLPEGRGLWRNSNLTEIPLDNRPLKTDVNWERLDEVTMSGSERITALTSTRSNPAHRLYLGTSRAGLYRLDSASGENPVLRSISIDSISVGYVNSIAVDEANGDRLLAAFSNYNLQSIFYSRDAGEHWEPVSGNLEQNPDGKGNGPSVSWVAMLPVNGLTIYFAGTTTGLYSTMHLDGLNTVWKQEGPSVIGNVVVDMIATRTSDGFIAVGTHGRGIFSANVAQALIEAHLLVSRGTLSFDTVGVGSSGLDTFEIINRDDSRRDISGVASVVEGPFEIVDGGGVFSVKPGESHRVIVRFLPVTAGLLGGRIQILHDATTPGGSQTVWLVGRGDGIGEVRQERSLVTELGLYPQVLSDQGEVRMLLEEAGEYSIQVVDQLGRIYRISEMKRFAAGEHHFSVDAEGYPSGSYMVQVVSGNGAVTTARFMVKK